MPAHAGPVQLGAGGWGLGAPPPTQEGDPELRPLLLKIYKLMVIQIKVISKQRLIEAEFLFCVNEMS